LYFWTLSNTPSSESYRNYSREGPSAPWSESVGQSVTFGTKAAIVLCSQPLIPEMFVICFIWSPAVRSI